ncbi:hypothetical protein [Marinomonas arctica]|uniref:hypothetical protein n=1 Tax=Marinomonas arctica TaxID=383750 RepID=UPI001CB7D6DA|nr:hypothetical protein [Marinomonas arctica]
MTLASIQAVKNRQVKQENTNNKIIPVEGCADTSSHTGRPKNLTGVEAYQTTPASTWRIKANTTAL